MTNRIRLEHDGPPVSTFDPEVDKYLKDLYKAHKKGEQYNLFCPLNHQGRMYLRNLDGRMFASHYQATDCPIKRIAIGESVEAQIAKDLYCRAAEDAGFSAEQEQVITSNGAVVAVLDVSIRTEHVWFAPEPQFSYDDLSNIRRRTTAAFNQGCLRFWIPGNIRSGDTFAKTYGDYLQGKVPLLRHNDDDINWSGSLPVKGSVKVRSLMRIMQEMCNQNGRWPHCPITRKSYCNNWHPHFEPMNAWTVEDTVAGIGHGHLTVLQTWDGFVWIVHADDVLIYQRLMLEAGLTHDGGFRPGSGRKPPDLAEGYDDRIRLCNSERCDVADCGKNVFRSNKRKLCEEHYNDLVRWLEAEQEWENLVVRWLAAERNSIEQWLTAEREWEIAKWHEEQQDREQLAREVARKYKEEMLLRAEEFQNGLNRAKIVDLMEDTRQPDDVRELAELNLRLVDSGEKPSADALAELDERKFIPKIGRGRCPGCGWHPDWHGRHAPICTNTDAKWN